MTIEVLTVESLEGLKFKELIDLDNEIKETTFGESDLVSTIHALLIHTSNKIEKNILSKVLSNYEFLLELNDHGGNKKCLTSLNL